MRNRDEIIRGLKCLADVDPEHNTCVGCPYIDEDKECDEAIALDVLALMGAGGSA